MAEQRPARSHLEPRHIFFIVKDHVIQHGVYIGLVSTVLPNWHNLRLHCGKNLSSINARFNRSLHVSNMRVRHCFCSHDNKQVPLDFHLPLEWRPVKARINRSIVARRMAGLSRKLLRLRGSDQWHWQRPSHSFSSTRERGIVGNREQEAERVSGQNNVFSFRYFVIVRWSWMHFLDKKNSCAWAFDMTFWIVFKFPSSSYSALKTLKVAQ